MSRKKLSVILGVVVATLALAVTFLATRGDGPAPERLALSVSSQKALDEFREISTPEKTEPAPQVLLAPAEARWWPLVSGMATELNLANLPLPDGATWIGYSINHTDAQQIKFAGAAYPAVYIGFQNTETAVDFDPTGSCSCTEYRRGAISMLTPSSVAAYDLGLPSWADDGPQLDVTEASWTWDLGSYRDLIAADAVTPRVVDAHFTDLGLGGDVTWTATADDPRGPWRGELTGFDTAAVDVERIPADVDLSDDDAVCDNSGCYSGEEKLELGTWEHALAGEWSFGTPDLSAPYFGVPNAPTDGTLFDWADKRALVWTWNPSYWRGSITQSELTGSGAIETLNFQVSESGEVAELTVRFVGDPIEGADHG